MTTASARPPAAEVLVPERASDPGRWLEAAAWTAIAFSCLQVLLFSFGRDQGIYAVVAEGVVGGRMPYRDVWDFKPPGIYLVYALAHALFGKSMLAPRVLEVAGMLAMVLAMRRIGELCFGSRRVGSVSGALACFIHAQLEFWHTGQPESFGGFATVVALWLALAEPPRGRRAWLLVAQGLLWGVAFLMKPPLGGAAIVTAAYLVRRARDRGATWRPAFAEPAIVAAASLLPIALMAAWFVLRGAWPALSWTMFEFTPGYTALGTEGRNAARAFYWAFEEAFFKFSALAPAGVLAALLIHTVHEREREAVTLILGVIAMQLVGVTMQGKFFQYHYSASLQLIALLGGLGLYKLWRRFLDGGIPGIATFAALVAVLASMREAARDLPDDFWDRSALRMRWLAGRGELASREAADERLSYVADYSLAANRRVAAAVARRAPPGAGAYVWGFEPVVYWLAERRPPTRFIYDVPQRASWQRDRSRSELMQALRAVPPAVVVVQRNDVFPMVTGDDLDSARAVATFPEFEKMLRDDYALAETIEDFDLYQKR
jgi:hypothetical protein